ncbi:MULTISPECIES: hypothetical protein [Ramlibacter]|uniref:Uncharacterized protein n=1 Tax=Ramlibacter aquaticus TaxID=2780094 RepID=A0ABR9SIR9_9BURK|nr:MULTISPECIES: hypothetical protein [Ramlibacter]MBE7942264.1 hypothetical protein [Ramlibacter aquaticus]
MDQPDAPRATQVDQRLRKERSLAPTMRRIEQLPAGVMVEWDGRAWLVGSNGRMRPWSFEGYGPAQYAPADELRVLPPASILAAIRVGYVPAVHATAQ